MFFRQLREFAQASWAYLRRKIRTQTGNTRVVDVGGDGDCGFRSIAATIIDHVLTHPQLNRKRLSTVLNRHFQYFPWQRTENMNGLMTSNEIMKSLIGQIEMPILIKSLGFTLRQLAVDELVKHPEKYPGAFVENNENTSPEMMRKPRTWIDHCSILALSNALNIPFEVKLVSWGKEVPSTYLISETSENTITNPKGVIYLEGNHYMPQVSKENAAKIKKKCLSFEKKVAPLFHDAVSDKAMPAIMKIVNAEQQRISKSFVTIQNRFIAMMMAEEINKDKLLNAYIKTMNSSDYLKVRTSYVNKARGDEFFEQALGLSTHDPDNAKHSPQLSFEQEFIVQLIDGLSRELSVKSEEHVDAFFEEMGASAKETKQIKL